MYNNKAYIIKTKTNLHAGSGDTNFGIVDNQVQRDTISNIPVINSSSLKGAIRDHFKDFLSETNQTISNTEVKPFVFNTIFGDEQKNLDSDDKVTYKNQFLSVSGPVSSTISDTDIATFYNTNKGTYNPLVTTPNGTYRAATQDISYHVSNGSEVKVNIEGQNVIGWSGDSSPTESGYTAGTNLFDTIDKVLLGLSGESSYKVVDSTGTVQTYPATPQSSSQLISSCLDELETDLDRIAKSQSELGARMNYVESTDSRLSSNEITFTKLQSNNEDIDVAKASVEVSSAQSVYEAALSVTAKVTKASLVDYLR